MATDYGLRLRKARKHADLTQVELSTRTGIPQSTISTAERMGHGSTETVVYARACGVDAHWLATGEGEMLGASEPKGAIFDAMTERENALLYNFRSLIDEDQDELYQEIERRAMKTRAHIEKVLSKMKSR